MTGKAPPKHQSQQRSRRKRKRNSPGNPDPDAEVIALSPEVLIATSRFVCEMCQKGFQREQNLRLHLRGHNIPSELRQREDGEVRRRVYVCPVPTCVHHNPARALGDITGIKKHYSRKHCAKTWECETCNKKYALESDLRAHQKHCNGQDFACNCGSCFTRKDTYERHRLFCDVMAAEAAKLPSSSSVPKTTLDLTSCVVALPSVHGNRQLYVPKPASNANPEPPDQRTAAPPVPSFNPMDLLPDNPDFLANVPFGLTQLLNSSYGELFGPSPTSLLGALQSERNSNGNKNIFADCYNPVPAPTQSSMSNPNLSLSSSFLEANNKECNFEIDSLLDYSFLGSTMAGPTLSLSTSTGDNNYGVTMDNGAGCSKLLPMSGPDLSLNTSVVGITPEENRSLYYSPSMAATALLQKAAEMGVMTSSGGGNEANGEPPSDAPQTSFFLQLFSSFKSSKESDLQVFGRRREENYYCQGSTSSKPSMNEMAPLGESNDLTTLTMNTAGLFGGETNAKYMKDDQAMNAPPLSLSMDDFPWFEGSGTRQFAPQKEKEINGFNAAGFGEDQMGSFKYPGW